MNNVYDIKFSLFYDQCIWYYLLFLFWQATTKLFLDGQFVESKAKNWIDLHNPVSKYLMMSV